MVVKLERKSISNRSGDSFEDRKGKGTQKEKILLSSIGVYKERKPRRRRGGGNERNNIRA